MCFIPGGGPHGGYGYIDIKLGSSIWEVKSLASAQRGRGAAQLNRYIAASERLNAVDPSKPVLQKGYPIERLDVPVMGGTLIIDNYRERIKTIYGLMNTAESLPINMKKAQKRSTPRKWRGMRP